MGEVVVEVVVVEVVVLEVAVVVASGEHLGAAIEMLDERARADVQPAARVRRRHARRAVARRLAAQEVVVACGEG